MNRNDCSLYMIMAVGVGLMLAANIAGSVSVTFSVGCCLTVSAAALGCLNGGQQLVGWRAQYLTALGLASLVAMPLVVQAVMPQSLLMLPSLAGILIVSSLAMAAIAIACHVVTSRWCRLVSQS